jgi:hypothetical protein
MGAMAYLISDRGRGEVNAVTIIVTALAAGAILGFRNSQDRTRGREGRHDPWRMRVVAAALLGLITCRESHDIVLLAAAAVSGAFDLASAAFCCGVLWPRRLRGKLPESLIYFDHLARRPNLPDTFQQLRFLLEDPESLSVNRC